MTTPRQPFNIAIACWAVIGAAVIGGCGGSDGPAVTVDGVEIPRDAFDALHADVAALDDDERAGSAVLLILREAFVSRALTDLDVELSNAAVEAALSNNLTSIEARGDIDEILTTRNQTRDRLRAEAELDTVRDAVGERLVRTEGDGFDIDAAYQQYSLVHAEVCIHQMQLADVEDFDTALVRLNAGEKFATIAREMSIDPFADRDDGVGAGGDLGCSAPNALPPGLAEATIEAPLREPTGPVASSVGIHLLVVDDRTVAELVDVRDDVIEAAVPVQGPELFRGWAVGVLNTIEVDVDEAYGRWGVLPETDPVPTVVPKYRFGDIINQ